MSAPNVGLVRMRFAFPQDRQCFGDIIVGVDSIASINKSKIKSEMMDKYVYSSVSLDRGDAVTLVQYLNDSFHPHFIFHLIHLADFTYSLTPRPRPLL